MVIKTDKKVLQKTNVKQKQTVNVKVQIGDVKKKRARKPRKSGGGGGGDSQIQSPYAQPYHPVYIQSGYPGPQEPYGSNALLEKLNSTMTTHHEELKNSLLSKVPPVSQSGSIPIPTPHSSIPPSISHPNPVPPIPHPTTSISHLSSVDSNPHDIQPFKKRPVVLPMMADDSSEKSKIGETGETFFGRITHNQTPSNSGLLKDIIDKGPGNETLHGLSNVSKPDFLYRSINTKASEPRKPEKSSNPLRRPNEWNLFNTAHKKLGMTQKEISIKYQNEKKDKK